jgi:hypothetical protein
MLGHRQADLITIATCTCHVTLPVASENHSGNERMMSSDHCYCDLSSNGCGVVTQACCYCDISKVSTKS